MACRIVLKGLLRLLLRTTAAALAVVYVGWNAYWLAQAQIPPSLFKSLTGLPAPTTGGTRSLRQLLAGHWLESLRYNAMTVPICGLLVLTGGWLAGRGLRRRPPVLPNWIAWSWLLVLATAWLLKLTGDPRYW